MIRDGLAVVGFSVMVFGVGARFGFEMACIIGGATLLALAVIGAIQK
jgi:hypothetical protein